jgi:hypothetical protein
VSYGGHVDEALPYARRAAPTSSSADLLALARPRRFATRELYPFNAFYGHAELLRKYAGVTASSPLKVAIEHGPTFFPNPQDPDLAAWLPRYFCAAPARARFFDENAVHGTKAAAIGPLILYAQAVAPPQPSSMRRLVFFDAHSSEYLTASYDLDVAIARLVALRSEFDEVVVCLYWRDILLGRAEPYLRRGFRCVTAGHMFDAQFLFRLVEIISSASIVLTDRVGSHLLYALALDRPVWLEYSPAEYAPSQNSRYGIVGAPVEGDVVDRASDLFARRVEEVQPDQREFANEFGGTNYLRSPDELAALIAEAEIAYRSETPRTQRLRLRSVATARYLWNAKPW